MRLRCVDLRSCDGCITSLSLLLFCHCSLCTADALMAASSCASCAWQRLKVSCDRPPETDPRFYCYQIIPGLHALINICHTVWCITAVCALICAENPSQEILFVLKIKHMFNHLELCETWILNYGYTKSMVKDQVPVLKSWTFSSLMLVFYVFIVG